MPIDITNVVGNDTIEQLREVGEIQLQSTESDCVLIRWIEPEFETLPILTYAVSERVPDLIEGVFSIPKLKQFSEYGDENDPTCGEGIVTLHGDYEKRLLEQHSEVGEQAFIKWFAEKAWFPVCVEGHKFLITLLRKENIPFTAPEIDNALFDFQCALAKLKSNQAVSQNGIVAIADWIDTEKNAEYHSAAIMLAYILVSNNGLGWNRAWIFQEGDSDNKSLSWECHTALGHTRERDWRREVEGLEFTNDLQEEVGAISLPTLSERDRLYDHCTGNLKWTVEKHFMACFGSKVTSEKEFYPILAHDRTLTNRFSTAVRNHIGNEYESGMDYRNQNELTPIWFLQMNLKQEKILVALSEPYTIGERVPPVMETTAVLRWMQHVLPNWLAQGTGVCPKEKIEEEVKEKFKNLQ